MASRPGGALYIGVTSDLLRRVEQHKAALTDGHVRRYNISRLVWCEMHETMESAISREKALKRWQRAWKERLIRQSNPTWRDLSGDLL